MAQIDGLPLENLEVTQEFYTSKDGTNIPMFLMRQKGVDPRPQPMLLYGYGGCASSDVGSLALLPSAMTSLQCIGMSNLEK